MEFGIENCGMLMRKKGKYAKSEGIKLPNEYKLQEIELQRGCKDLEALEAGGIKNEDKKKTDRQYLRRVRKILQS